LFPDVSGNLLPHSKALRHEAALRSLSAVSAEPGSSFPVSADTDQPLPQHLHKEKPKPPVSWASLFSSEIGGNARGPVADMAPKPRLAVVRLSPEEELRRQAHLSRIDPATGTLRCKACKKVTEGDLCLVPSSAVSLRLAFSCAGWPRTPPLQALPSYPALMQHLKQKHRGINSIDALFFDDSDDDQQQQQQQQKHSARPAPRSAVSLFDWMTLVPSNKQVTAGCKELGRRFAYPGRPRCIVTLPQ